MTPDTNQRDEKLSAALRELASCSRQSASSELAITLKDAFRHHHARRRRALRVRIVLVSLCIAALAGSFLLKKPPVRNNSEGTTAIRTIPPLEVIPPPELSASQTRLPPETSAKSRKNQANPSGFWTLPSVDLIPAGDQLRVVRMELRAEDLRLVGAPVTDAIARHRVTADFVVGQDGTPYAVRLVQANY
jgi:hypothetical protein